MDLQKIVKSERPTLVYLYSQTCLPCYKVRSDLDTILNKCDNIQYIKINTSNDEFKIPSDYTIVTPYILVYKKGIKIKEFFGNKGPNKIDIAKIEKLLNKLIRE